MRKAKFACLLLCLLMAFGSFSACSGKQPSDPVKTDEIKPGVTDESGYVYTSPDVNYDNALFNVFTWNGTDEWVLETTEHSTQIEAQTYHHLIGVEGELGIEFNIAQSISGSYGKHIDFISRVAMLSGDDNIHLVCQYSLAAAYGVLQGLYTDLNTLDYLRWDAPYWSDDFQNVNTVNGKMFYCTGELSSSVINNLQLLVFNYNMVQDYGLGDLYAMVKDGSWTMDKLKELTEGVYSDLNQNNIADPGDMFGLVTKDTSRIDPWQYACNLIAMKTNDLQELELNRELYTEIGANVIDKISGVLLNSKNSGAYCEQPNSNKGSYSTAMQDGHAMFSSEVAYEIIKNINPTGLDYGVLPFPKYNADQDGYYTCLGMPYSMFAVPAQSQTANMSAAVLEALAHSGYTDLSPFIFETCLKSRYSKRPEDAEMFDILRNGIVYDPGRVYDNVQCYTFVRSLVHSGEAITTYYQERVSRYANGLKDINFAFA